MSLERTITSDELRLLVEQAMSSTSATKNVADVAVDIFNKNELIGVTIRARDIVRHIYALFETIREGFGTYSVQYFEYDEEKDRIKLIGFNRDKMCVTYVPGDLAVPRPAHGQTTEISFQHPANNVVRVEIRFPHMITKDSKAASFANAADAGIVAERFWWSGEAYQIRSMEPYKNSSLSTPAVMITCEPKNDEPETKFIIDNTYILEPNATQYVSVIYFDEHGDDQVHDEPGFIFFKRVA